MIYLLKYRYNILRSRKVYQKYQISMNVIILTIMNKKREKTIITVKRNLMIKFK